MKIGIIILNHNKKKLLSDCLTSINNLRYRNFVTIVIDNASNDGSSELIKEKYKSVFLIELNYNSSFCVGNNIGIEKAFNLGCEAVVLLNNDTIVDPGFLSEMVNMIDDKKKIGMVASKIFLMKSPGFIDSTGLVMTPDGLGQNRFFNEKDKYFSENEVFCPAGAGALYSKALLEDIKQENQYFDEDFGFFVEESDLGWRARLKGWKCFFAPKAVVYHLKSATTGRFSEFIAYYVNKNIFFNIIKNYPSTFALKALFLMFFKYPLLFFGIFFKKGVGYKIENNIGFIKVTRIILRSLASVFVKIPSLLRKRLYIQKNKVVKNKEVAEWFNDENLSISFFKSVFK